MEELNLDSELLEPMKERLEQSIDMLTKNAILTKKRIWNNIQNQYRSN